MTLKHSTYRGYILSGLAAAIALALPLAPVSVSAQEPVRIGLSLYSQLQQRWLFDAEAFVAAATANGDDVIVQYADGDPAKQTQQIQNMFSRGIDVLVIAATDAAVGANLIDEARAEGVKTIVYDQGIFTTKADWMITRNQDMVGELQMAAALKFAPSGNYAILQGDPGSDVAQAADRAYTRSLDGVKGVNVVYDDFIAGWSPSLAQSEAESILTRFNDDIAAFVVNNDGMATGVIQALRGAGLNGKVFVSGLDGDEANLALVARGDQTMTVYTPVDQMGTLAANAAHALGIGEVPASNAVAQTTAGEVPLWQLDLIPVTQENLCEVVQKIIPAGWADPARVFEGSKVECK